jgi:predicted metalloprotease
MTFNPNAQLDPSQVEDTRGSGRMGGMGTRGVAIGGGGLGTLVLLVILFLASNGQTGSGNGGLGGLGGITIDPNASEGPGIQQTCRTGADANARDDCRIVAYVNSVQAYWKAEFQRSGSGQYRPALTTFFSGQTQTGCGGADTSSGPFYCPNDGHVWIDLGFFDQLRTQFGATGGSLAQGYVIAHEYGHHVQDLLGDLGGGGAGATGATGQSVRTELQADCYAGVWAGNSVSTGFLQPITEAQVADALNAASAVGDDRVQQATQGRVNPDSWTHGSSAQRQKWFMAGFNSKQPSACDTSGPL